MEVIQIPEHARACAGREVALQMSVLEGIRVLDLTEALAGPYCTMLLGDLGADVVKIERPGAGDASRRWGPPWVGTESAYFLAVNRNKRSVALDIKAAADREHLRRLVDQADVFVCNVRRSETLRELGLDPETLRAGRPRLIYCSISAYGRTGPYADRGGYDVVAQGEAGLMALTGEEGDGPMRWPVAIADLSCGLWSATSILAALYARERTGHGQVLDQSLLESQLSWASVIAAQHLASGQPPGRLGNRHANIVPYEVYEARDRHLIVAVGTEQHWRRFCAVLGLGEAVRDAPGFATNAARLRNRAELNAVLQPVFAREPAAHWLAALREAEIPCGPVNGLEEALNDPQVRHRGMIVEFEHPMGPLRVLGDPVHLSDTPVTYRRRPPLLGEHTAEVLRQAEAHLRPLAPPPPAASVPEQLRPPRYVAALPARLVHRGAVAAATTLDVSEGGCVVEVRGAPPRAGDEVELHVAMGAVRASVSGVVRWVEPGADGAATAGVRVLAGPLDGSWHELVTQVVLSGARAAIA
jgi:crotonobetainyl-CoA:carnitine CoA-transferase CaiB-like acyl-CoA transferase